MNGRPSRRALLLKLGQRVVEIDQHHHAGLGGDTGKRNEADGHRDREIEAEPPHQPKAADQRKRHREHDDQRLGDAPEIEVEQQEDNEDGHRHHDLQPRFGALVIFELAAPRRVIARREIDFGRHRLLRVGDIAAEIAVAQIDKDVERKLRVLGADA